VIQSSGVLTKTPSVTVWQGTPSTWPHQLNLGQFWSSYSGIYRSNIWVAALVNKIASATARLPLKVYERGADNERNPADDHPYADLLRRPNQMHDPYTFWTWTRSTIDIFGETFWGKVRDRGGRPIELVPLHPTAMSSTVDSEGRITWAWDNGTSRIDDINRRDLVHFKLYNPDSLIRGMSPLEPLRSTLENEAGARAANSAMWRNGARPSALLRHPNTLSTPAQERLRASWNDLHSGTDNWAKTVILEEGMEAQLLPLNVEDLQYIESRKLNREEACAIYDVPPPVVHILDRATFSNITEQMRSMYRDTMAPKLRFLESTLEMELRDGRMGDRNRQPDFGEGVYAEFLMDEVLRGDFEVRVPAIAQAIQTGQLTPNEGRRIENRPPVEGGDVLLVNGALLPIDALATSTETPPGEPTVDDEPLAGVIPIRSLMGRLARQKTLDDIDPAALVQGLNGTAKTVLEQLDQAKAAGESITQFRERIKALGG
jgi:HK97 family phage portal protein